MCSSLNTNLKCIIFVLFAYVFSHFSPRDGLWTPEEPLFFTSGAFLSGQSDFLKTWIVIVKATCGDLAHLGTLCNICVGPAKVVKASPVLVQVPEMEISPNLKGKGQPKYTLQEASMTWPPLSEQFSKAIYHFSTSTSRQNKSDLRYRLVNKQGSQGSSTIMYACFCLIPSNHLSKSLAASIIVQYKEHKNTLQIGTCLPLENHLARVTNISTPHLSPWCWGQWP